MVYLGLSWVEILKNYRLLGHGKDFIFSWVESFAQSEMCLRFPKWRFLKLPTTKRLWEGQRSELMQSIQTKTEELFILLISSLVSMCNVTIWALWCTVWEEEGIDVHY